MCSGEACPEHLAARLDQLEAEVRELRAQEAERERKLSTVTRVVAAAVGPVPDRGNPVPQALADALEAPPQPGVIPVTVQAGGHEATILVAGEHPPVHAVEAWQAVCAALPQDSAGGVRLPARADLTRAVAAVACGKAVVVNPAVDASLRRAALRAAARATRMASASAAGQVGCKRA